MTSKSSISDKDFLALIGRVAVEGARLENGLMVFISELMFGDNDYGISVFTGMNYSIVYKMALPTYYAKVTNAKYDAEFEKILELLNEVVQERNTIVHAVWTIKKNKNEGVFLGTTKTKKEKKHLPNFKIGTKSEKEMIELIDKIVSIRKSLESFANKLTEEDFLGRRETHNFPF